METIQDGGQPYKPVGYSCDHKGQDGDYTGGELWYFVSDDGTDSLKDLCAGDSIVLTVNEPVLMDGNKKDSVCSVKKEVAPVLATVSHLAKMAWSPHGSGVVPHIAPPQGM